MAEMNQKRVIRLSKSCIGEAEKLAVMEVLNNEYLGMGLQVQEFERFLTAYFGRPAVCVVNGTAALQLALQGAGIGHGDEVLVQSLTYVASFQAISATGARPVACDVNRDTATISLKDAALRLTQKTKAIMPVHYGGGVGRLDEIYNFANQYNLRVIEDAAHAFGTKYDDKTIGGFGDIACFSFDGIKNITSGEGGCIVSDDVELLNKIRDGRLLGVERDTEKRYAGKRSWNFDVKAQGWRYHMSDIMAAIGIQQLKRIDEFTSTRRMLAKKYVDILKDADFLSLFNFDYDDVVPHIFPIKLKNGESRDALISHLLSRGIQSGIHYQPNHILSFYNSNTELENTNWLASRLLTLPLHADMSENDVIFVTDALASYFRS